MENILKTESVDFEQTLAVDILLDTLVHHSSFDTSALKFGIPQCRIVQTTAGGIFKITTGDNVTCSQCQDIMVSNNFDRMQ